jgi:hypothetical protein
MNVRRSCAWILMGVGLVLPVGVIGGQANGKKTNRVVIYPGETLTASVLKGRGLAKVENYGSCLVVDADDQQLADLERSFPGQVKKADHFRKLELRSMTVDTSVGEPNIAAQLQERSGPGGPRLRLVQFKGPIQPEWMELLKSAGKVKIINYVPNNAYLVRMDPKAEKALEAQLDPAGPVQWIGKYHPQYKLRPALLNLAAPTVEIYLAVANTEDAAAAVADVQRWAIREVEPPRAVLNQINLRLEVRVADLAQIAAIPDVLWIDPVRKLTRTDYLQALTLATGEDNITPADYLDFLLNQVGFSTDHLQYPIADVADSGLDRGNALTGNVLTRPWLPIFYKFGGTVDPEAMCGQLPSPFKPSRIVYNDQADTDGHGTLVASMLGGYEDQPTEILNCYTEGQEVVCTREIVQVCVTNGFTVGDSPACAGPNPPPCCPTLTCTNFDITCSIVTNVTCVTNCVVVINNDNFFAPPWCLVRGGFGLGVSPFGRMGASRGGAEGGFAGPFDHALQIYLQAARMSNNSWGEVLAVGDNDGEYSALSQAYDIVTRDAVGTGSTNPPTPGSFPVNQEMIYVFAGGNANGLDGVGGFGDVLITPPATAKNVLSVGATDLAHPGNLAPFTSFGPTRDGRVKPEIMAPGLGIAGATSQASYTHTQCGGCSPNNPGPPPCAGGFFLLEVLHRLYVAPNVVQYDPLAGCGVSAYNGTSFAAPAVTGGAQLLWWYFQNRLALFQPSPAMVKAYLCNSAIFLPITNPLTGVQDKLPSPAQGMGRMDLQKMFDGVPRVIRDQSAPRAIDIPVATTNAIVQQTYVNRTGQSYELSGVVADATKPFRVTLAWTDLAGSPANFKQLVNDLDLEVTMNGTLYKGNVFDRQFSKVASNSLPDDINNLESVFLPPGQTGTWTVVVRAANIAGDAVPNVGTGNDQDFALVVYNGTAASDIPNTPTNDTCQAAQLINVYPFVWTNNLVKPPYHNNHPSPTAGRGGIDQFFVIPTPTLGTVFTADTFGSSFNTVLSVWKGTCGALEEVTSNDNASLTNFQSAVTWTVLETNDYYIVVEGSKNATGTVVLNVQSSASLITFSATNLNFGSVLVGAQSGLQTVTLNNGSSQNLIVSSVGVAGPNSASFEVVAENCEGNFLPPGGICNITLRFAPTLAGTNSATLVVNDNATGSPRTLPLTGVGLAPVPIICNVTSNVAFGTVSIGFTSAVQSVSLTNCGTAALFVTNTLTSGGAAGDFVIVGDSCAGNSIAPGAGCSVSVVFVPTASGPRTTSLLLNDNAAGSPHAFALSGTGQLPAPVVCLSGNSIDFGNVPVGGTSSVSSVTLSNCGSSVLSITGVSLTGASASQFIITADSCTGGSIPIGGTCTVSLRAVPTSIGVLSAALSIAHNASGSPTVIALTGLGGGSQPDGQVARKAKEKYYVGNDIFTPTAPQSQQSVPVKGKRGKARPFYVRVQNDGNSPDTFVMAGSGDLAQAYTVRYFLGSTDGLEITEAVKAGTFSTANLGPGALTGNATLIRVEVTAEVNAIAGTYPVTVTFRSTSNLLKEDSVTGSVTIR